MATTVGCVVESAGGEFVTREFPLRELGPSDVEVEIMYSGMCHSDVDMASNFWGVSRYPLVPGHEGVGRVVATGEGVKTLQVGQVVGIGWMRDCCGQCPSCQHGEENICYKGYTGLFVGIHEGGTKNTGTFAHKVRINERFAFPLPEGLDPARAGPLLCAGMTVYQPLSKYIRWAGQSVGVIGIGGLGHLAIKFASAMGTDVTVFSSSPDKEEEARKFGAKYFVCTKDAETMAKQARSLDLIIDTSPVAVDWKQYLLFLRPGGVFCIAGVPGGDITVPVANLVMCQRSVVGTMVSGTHVIKEMLNFAAVNQVYPEVETWDFKDINAAADRVRAGKARYRIVLKW